MDDNQLADAAYEEKFRQNMAMLRTSARVLWRDTYRSFAMFAVIAVPAIIYFYIWREIIG